MNPVDCIVTPEAKARVIAAVVEFIESGEFARIEARSRERLAKLPPPPPMEPWRLEQIERELAEAGRGPRSAASWGIVA